MHQSPEPPGRRPPKFDKSEIRHGCLATDRCQTAQMTIREGFRRVARLDACLDDRGDIGATLFGGRCQSRDRLPPPGVARGRIANREDIR